MSQPSKSLITPVDIADMTSEEIGIYVSGGYGVSKRVAMIAAIRLMAVRLAGK